MNKYLPDPDYTRTRLELTAAQAARLRAKLEALYGAEAVDAVFDELLRLMRVFHAHEIDTMPESAAPADTVGGFSEKDAILITYGDLIKSADRYPLLSLSDLVHTYLRDVFNILHILPFFPYSSDRGFAVIDFKEVDPRLGSWADINRLSGDFRLMFDGVFNHVSSRSPWFKSFLNQNPEYVDFFTVFGEDDPVDEQELRRLFRPRTSDVLTRFMTLNGPRRVWTTFGPDQVDLKFQNPKVLLKMVDILLFYVRQGAELIRLDAVTYLWDELGTNGVHLWQTHTIIKLFRDIMDIVAPYVMLVTETNVPHKENISYFGDGRDEAQMVYNFALPPLILHTFQTADAGRISNWAAELSAPCAEATFLNFLDSHDGIGVLGARGIMTDEEIAAMISRVEQHSGYISYKKESDGSETAYEMNITSYSAINCDSVNESDELQIGRYLAARSIAMVLPGIPGVYLHGLLGTRNDVDAVLRGEEKRSINRRNIDRGELFAMLDDRQSLTSRIARGISRMLRVRCACAAFHPAAEHRVLDAGKHVFAIERIAHAGKARVVCYCNVAAQSQQIDLPQSAAGDGLHDMLGDCPVPSGTYSLKPYEVLWVRCG